MTSPYLRKLCLPGYTEEVLETVCVQVRDCNPVHILYSTYKAKNDYVLSIATTTQDVYPSTVYSAKLLLW